jgi:hypothetical protein
MKIFYILKDVTIVLGECEFRVERVVARDYPP